MQGGFFSLFANMMQKLKGGPMLKASKKDNLVDVRRVKQIARENRVETLARLHASAEGLSTRQALINRKEYGANQILNRKHESKWHYLFTAFANPFCILLALLFVLLILDLFVLGKNHLLIASLILLMIVTSSVISFIQNIKTAENADQLLKMVSVTTNVKRDGEDQELPTEQVVVGDVINLAAGDMVPADLRLLRSKDLFCQTSSINGNYDPVEKNANKMSHLREVDNYLDYPNILYEGTTIVSGSGVGVVFATGERTIFGRLLQDLNKKQLRKNAFDLGLKSITKSALLTTLIASCLIFVLTSLRLGQEELALVFAVALTASVTPFLSPIVVRENLVNGSKKIAQKGAVVKKLNSIQKLGAADILCTDKTGLLTQDQVVLERHYDLNLQETPRVLKLSYLNSYYQTGMKDLIDNAVIDAASSELDVNEIQRDYNKIDEIPFDYTRKRMSVVVANSDANHGEHLLVTKGDFAEMLRVASYVEMNGQIFPLTKEREEIILKQIADLNEDGLRVLLLGYKKNPAPVGEFAVSDEKDLIIAGFLTFLDPPKESARASLTKLEQAGLKVKILTGDNEAVTRTLGLQVGLKIDPIYTAADFEDKNDQEIARMVEESDVFVQMTPKVKTKIIKALKENGHTVSYLGDKNNDAIAMREADLGLALDNAADIAKEVASIILMHKDLSVLESSIEISRNTFGNIMKYLKLMLTSNAACVGAMVVSAICLPFLPLASGQLLLLNLVLAISCALMSFDKMSPAYLKKPGKWSFKNLPSFMMTFGSVLGTFDILALFGLYYFVVPFLAKGNLTYEIVLFETGWFIACLWLHQVMLLTLRAEKLFLAMPAWLSLVLLFLVISMTILPFTSLGQSLEFINLPSWYLLFIAGLSLLLVIVTSLVKRFYLAKHQFLI